jgi:hypothetical protein
MQNMAEGGIVAFAGNEGSLVQGEPSVWEKIMGANEKWRTNTGNTLSEAGRERQREEVRNMFGVSPYPAVSDVYDEKTLDADAATALANMAPYGSPVTTAKNKVIDKGGAPTVAPRPKVAASTPAVAPVPAKDFLTQQREMEGRYGDVTDPLEARRKAITEADVAGRREGIAALKADQESEMKSMFEGKEERIGKREKELEKSKDVNTGMAFLEAGLAMMQATGPGLAGIAKGAGVGLKSYSAGIDKIKSAQEKLDDARDRMEELRQNQSSMNKREVRAEEKGIRDTTVAGNRDLLAGIEQATGEKRADIRAAVTTNMAREESALYRDFKAKEEQLNRQNRIQVAGMPGDQQKMLMALGGKGGLEAGLTKMQEIQADKTGAVYAKMFTEARTDAIKNGVEPPTATAFAASLRQLAAALNPGKVPSAVEVGATTRP